MKYNSICSTLTVKLLVVFALVVSFTFHACETEPMMDTCSTNLLDVNVSATTIEAGGDFIAEVEFLETIDLPDFQARDIVKLFLSEDNTLDGTDLNITSFNEITRNGDIVNLVFNEVPIAFDQDSGDYFLIVQLEGQPCGDGEVSDDDTEVIAVTIN